MFPEKTDLNHRILIQIQIFDNPINLVFSNTKYLVTINTQTFTQKERKLIIRIFCIKKSIYHIYGEDEKMFALFWN